MAIRPYWSGTIRVSLVSLQVDMYTALDGGHRIAFHMIHAPTGERVRQQLVVNDEPVEREDIIKGIEVEKGEYVTFRPEEISELKIPSSKTMELSTFVPYDAIDSIFFDTPYYLAPSGKADKKTFAVIRDSLRELKVMGLGQIVISGRERLCAIKPCGVGLLLETLHYADEIKSSGHYFGDIKPTDVDEEEKDLAKLLVQRKIGKFEPDNFHDRYFEAMEELVNARIENREIRQVVTDRPAAKVVNLMDALRASLKQDQPANANEQPKPKKSRKAG